MFTPRHYWLFFVCGGRRIKFYKNQLGRRIWSSNAISGMVGRLHKGVGWVGGHRNAKQILYGSGGNKAKLNRVMAEYFGLV